MLSEIREWSAIAISIFALGISFVFGCFAVIHSVSNEQNTSKQIEIDSRKQVARLFPKSEKTVVPWNRMKNKFDFKSETALLFQNVAIENTVTSCELEWQITSVQFSETSIRATQDVHRQIIGATASPGSYIECTAFPKIFEMFFVKDDLTTELDHLFGTNVDKPQKISGRLCVIATDSHGQEESSWFEFWVHAIDSENICLHIQRLRPVKFKLESVF